FVHGQDQDLDFRIDDLDLPGRLQAAQIGHGDVQDNQLRGGRFQEPNQFETVVGFPHHFHIVDGLNDSSYPSPEHHVIISQQYTERGCHDVPPSSCGETVSASMTMLFIPNFSLKCQ